MLGWDVIGVLHDLLKQGKSAAILVHVDTDEGLVGAGVALRGRGLRSQSLKAG